MTNIKKIFKTREWEGEREKNAFRKTTIKMVHDYFIWDLQQCNAWEHSASIFNLFCDSSDWTPKSAAFFVCVLSLVVLRVFMLIEQKWNGFCGHIFQHRFDISFASCIRFISLYENEKNCFFFMTFCQKIKMIISTLTAPQFSVINWCWRHSRWSNKRLTLHFPLALSLSLFLSSNCRQKPVSLLFAPHTKKTHQK